MPMPEYVKARYAYTRSTKNYHVYSLLDAQGNATPQDAKAPIGASPSIYIPMSSMIQVPFIEVTVHAVSSGKAGS